MAELFTVIATTGSDMNIATRSSREVEERVRCISYHHSSMLLLCAKQRCVTVTMIDQTKGASFLFWRENNHVDCSTVQAIVQVGLATI